MRELILKTKEELKEEYPAHCRGRIAKIRNDIIDDLIECFENLKVEVIDHE